MMSSWPRRARRVGLGVLVTVSRWHLLVRSRHARQPAGTLHQRRRATTVRFPEWASYAIAGEFIGRAPIFGRGFSTFLPSYRILDNQYLGLLIETGIVGLVAFLVAHRCRRCGGPRRGAQCNGRHATAAGAVAWRLPCCRGPHHGALRRPELLDGGLDAVPGDRPGRCGATGSTSVQAVPASGGSCDHGRRSHRAEDGGTSAWSGPCSPARRSSSLCIPTRASTPPRPPWCSCRRPRTLIPTTSGPPPTT